MKVLALACKLALVLIGAYGPGNFSNALPQKYPPMFPKTVALAFLGFVPQFTAPCSNFSNGSELDRAHLARCHTPLNPYIEAQLSKNFGIC